MPDETEGFAPDPAAELPLNLPPREEAAPESGTAEHLLASLRSLGGQFGPHGVALAAATLTNRDTLIRDLQEPDPFGAPTPDGTQPSATGAEPPLPEGIYGRVELPGMRSDTGWITEGTRGGQCVLVVRDWDDRPLGEYILGPACRLVHLPTPLKRPERREPAAITAGHDPWGRDADEPDDWDERNPF